MIGRLIEDLKIIFKYIILFIFGGSTYYILEVVWRGRSHSSMFILGGFCFLVIGELNEAYLTYKMSLVYQMFAGGIIVTLFEFLTGVFVNIILKLNVWDYSNLPFNLFGQICLPFSLIWIVVSLIVIVVDDWMRHFLFKEERPKYKIF